MESKSAQVGNVMKGVPPPDTTPATSVQDVGQPHMAPKNVLERRKLSPLTPYKAEAWERELRNAGALKRFAKILEGLRLGFRIDFPSISNVQAPPNKDSISEFSNEFESIIKKELDKGRYVGPFSAKALEDLIGPFQSSPLSIIPKPGKPGKFRIIQNFSFPHASNVPFPNPSVNSCIDVNNFPTTWGKFSVVYQLIANLPPGSEAATRDIAEAYRTVPLHPSQWPAGVVRISDSLFCVDTCVAFGAAPSAGAYGLVADGGAEIFRNKGLGPLDKWVDDHIFLRIRLEYLEQYNEHRKEWNRLFASEGMQQTGGRIWFGRMCTDTGKLEELSENCSKPLQDHSQRTPRSEHDKLFTFCLQDIDDLSEDLGIIWERLKDQLFSTSTLYTGFIWDIELRIVSLSPAKVDKYLVAIHKWRKRHAHALQDVQELYGKLLHASAAAPRGRAYLTSLEEMIAYCGKKPFLPHRAGEHVDKDLNWWSLLLQSGGVSRPIYPTAKLSNPLAFSDASSGIGLGIVIGKRWRAWRLIPGWKTRDGKRDIGWAEAVAFELLIYTIASIPNIGRHVLVYGDNTGVVEGWWNRRHRNRAVNGVFRRINEFIHNLSRPFDVTTNYVASAHNPADDPSRGIYGPAELLLPSIRLPAELDGFLIDATEPLSATELRLLHNGSYSAPAAKLINRELVRQQAAERARVSRAEEELVIDKELREA